MAAFSRRRRERLKANMARVRQSRPGSGPGVQVKTLKTFHVVPFSLEQDLGSVLAGVGFGLLLRLLDDSQA